MAFIWDEQTQKLFTYFMMTASVMFLSYQFIKRKKKSLELVGHIDSLYIYPVKACAGIKVEYAECTKLGLKYKDVTDRHWMIVDKNKDPIDLKVDSRLCLVKITLANDHIILDAPDMPSLKIPKVIPPTEKNQIQVKVNKDFPMDVVDCGEDVSKWISQFLNRPETRIVYSSSLLPKRDISKMPRKWKNNVRQGDVTAFSFLTSYMLESNSSLKQVNDSIEKPALMVQFRPNIVTDGSKPFDEDNWEYVKVGEDILFRKVEPCRRCIITTIDTATGKKSADNQPLKQLRSFRCIEPYGYSPCFGIYITLESAGMIRVGQPVYAQRN